MLRFRDFLREEQLDTSHFITDREELQRHLSQFSNAFAIKSDMEVVWRWHQGLYLDEDMLIDGYLPCQFRSAEAFQVINNVPLKSLVGSPIEVANNVEIRVGNRNLITSLVGGPRTVGAVFKVADFNGNIKSIEGLPEAAKVYRNYLEGVTSYHNVHKIIKRITTTIEVMECVTSDMLGFILVDGMFNLVCSTTTNDSIRECVDLLNSRIWRNERDLMDAKEELMNAGLKEYARL